MQVSFSLGLHPSKHKKLQNAYTDRSVSVQIDIIHHDFSCVSFGDYLPASFIIIYIYLWLKKKDAIPGEMHCCLGLPN